MTVADNAARRPPHQKMRRSLTDEKFLGLVWQVLVVGIVAGLVVWLWANALHNLNARRIATGLCH
jgi:general L-amino acid transport system permease protein